MLARLGTDADTPAPEATALAELTREVIACRACPRLVAWREEVARVRRRAYAGEAYWGRPVPPLGDDAPWLLVVGLAPAAHGGNRTGRIFTGDRSGDFLFAALHRAGLSSQAESVHIGDGLRLTGCRITAAVRCAPPANRPTREEQGRCARYLVRELALVPSARVVLALGGLAWDACLRAVAPPRPWPRFGHGAEVPLGDRVLLGSYHVSQQNTFTGRLTAAMLDAVIARAQDLRDPAELR